MKVLVVDDHPLVWEGIKSVLKDEDDMEAVGWANSGRQAEQMLSKIQPDVALVDLRLPGEYGINIIKKLRPLAPKCRFIILTTFADHQDIKQAMECRVNGYILKEALPQEMITALRLVHGGRPYYDPLVMELMVQKQNKQERLLSDLTERETEVLKAITDGLSNKEIADKLFVSENTVKKHVSNILSKLGLKDRTKAAVFAASCGMANHDPHAVLLS
ncbi:response regulator [Desulfofalx alkaliphila]|uniref:response regulator n=1 Tax=Desulfofalx alkaliphila TaxID=105483 RepID=UPI0004E1BB75|nr:response regulator transcription factor [Desulfofalx alkaliphila]